ncbi:hypothetical protein [Bowmanella yangjiangensis]|uniref:Uncharacterized protein n=1 Tax=Bowmanella yangjiangensis TaxID=2811230 RepID=A0ABS3CV01_9ALTE|nr:hypothetical protein [Bowmanella yangjiangensis]MBN7820923.1 hypothetical protein [Bowmanella yangjiangensis]
MRSLQKSKPILMLTPYIAVSGRGFNLCEDGGEKPFFRHFLVLQLFGLISNDIWYNQLDNNN